MPTYDYQCVSCGSTREVFHAISAPGPDRCEECGTTGQMKRLISPGGGLVFKGSGFYATDYKKGGSGKAEKKSEAPATPPCASGSCPADCPNAK